MPGHLFCIFSPLNLQATAILNYDIFLHCCAQAPAKIVQRKMAMKESLVPKPLFSFKSEYSSDNQSESSSDELQLGEDEYKIFSVTNWWQTAN